MECPYCKRQMERKSVVIGGGRGAVRSVYWRCQLCGYTSQARTEPVERLPRWRYR
jgi:transposase-like protein